MSEARPTSVRWNIIANYFGQGWAAVMGLAFLPIYIRYLGMEAYGLIGFHATLHAWLSFAGNILGPVVNRETARFTASPGDHQAIWDRLRTLEWIGLSCALAVAAAIGLLSQVITHHWLKSAGLAPETVIASVTMMGLMVGLRILETFYQGAIAGLQKQLCLNAITAVMATLRWPGAIAVLAWVAPTIETFFAWQVLVSVASLLAIRIAVYRTLPRPPSLPRPSWSALAALRDFSGGMVATTLLAMLLTHADKLLLSNMLDLQEFGYYMLANTVASGFFFLVTPISQAYYPRLSQLVAAGADKQLTLSYHQGSRLVTLSVGPLCLLITLFSEEVLFAWSGDRQLASRAAPLLSLLAAANGLHCLMHMPYMLQLAHGWSGFSARINAVACCILLPALVLAVPIYGPIAAGATWFALNAGYVLFGIALMHRQLLKTEKRDWYVRDTLKPLLPAIALLTLMRALFPDNLSRPAVAALLLGAAVALYAVLTLPIIRPGIIRQTDHGTH